MYMNVARWPDEQSSVYEMQSSVNLPRSHIQNWSYATKEKLAAIRRHGHLIWRVANSCGEVGLKTTCGQVISSARTREEARRAEMGEEGASGGRGRTFLEDLGPGYGYKTLVNTY